MLRMSSRGIRDQAKAKQINSEIALANYREGTKIGIMDSAKKHSLKRIFGSSAKKLVLGYGALAWLTLCVQVCAFPASSLAKSQPPAAQGPQSGVPAPQVTGTPSPTQQADQQASGTIGGMVVDQTGSIVVGAQVTLTRQDQSPSREATTGDDGQFSFANVAPGPFQLSIAA